MAATRRTPLRYLRTRRWAFLRSGPCRRRACPQKHCATGPGARWHGGSSIWVSYSFGSTSSYRIAPWMHVYRSNCHMVQAHSGTRGAVAPPGERNRDRGRMLERRGERAFELGKSRRLRNTEPLLPVGARQRPRAAGQGRQRDHGGEAPGRGPRGHVAPRDAEHAQTDGRRQAGTDIQRSSQCQKQSCTRARRASVRHRSWEHRLRVPHRGKAGHGCGEYKVKC